MADSADTLVAVSIADGVNPDSCPDEASLNRMAWLVFEAEGYTLGALSIVFADHDAVLALNKEWLGHDWHTDVISFLLEEDPVEGEIYIDVETAAERHAEFGVTLSQELKRYAVHGMLHLCGHDDATTEQRDTMRTLEDHYLAKLDG